VAEKAIYSLCCLIRGDIPNPERRYFDGATASSLGYGRVLQPKASSDQSYLTKFFVALP